MLSKCVCVCLCACLVALNGVHMSVYVQLSENTQACWCLHVRGGETETESLSFSLPRPCGMRLHILQHIAEGWGNLLLSKIIELLHPVISLIIMKASLQFSNYYSMPIMFLSNKEEHWCKTKRQDSISCLCLRAIQRWGTYTPTKYHPPVPHIKHLTTELTQLPNLHVINANCCHIQCVFSESNKVGRIYLHLQ